MVGHLLGLARGRVAFLQGLRGCGDVVEMRLGRRSFSVLNAPEAIHEVLVAQSGKFSKGALFDRVRPLMGNGLATSDGPFHLRQRRAMQPAFHRERVARYSETFVEVAGARVGGRPTGRVVAVEREMRELAVAMLVPTLFPFAEGSQTGRAIQDLGARVSGDLGVLVQGVLRATILPPALAVVPTPGRGKFLASAAALRTLAESAVRQARSTPESHGVLKFARDLQARDPGGGEGRCATTTGGALAPATVCCASHRGGPGRGVPRGGRPVDSAACPSSTGVFSEDQVSPGSRWPGGGAGPGSDCRCRTSRARRRPTGLPRHRPGPARRPRPGSPAARPGC